LAGGTGLSGLALANKHGAFDAAPENDFAMYVAVLASIGPVPLAVTTNLNINFLRKPAQKDLIAECRLIKLGNRLAVGEVQIYSEGEDEMVAHATSTYSIPPPEQRKA